VLNSAAFVILSEVKDLAWKVIFSQMLRERKVCDSIQ